MYTANINKDQASISNTITCRLFCCDSSAQFAGKQCNQIPGQDVLVIDDGKNQLNTIVRSLFQ